MQKKLFTLPSSEHGGALSGGHRKRQRPLCTKRPVHLVIKSRKNLYRNRDKIISILKNQAEKSAICIYGSAVAPDHIHLTIKIPHRSAYVKFIRALTGLLARKLGAKLWALPPFTRVIEWGKDFRGVLKYLAQNRKEASGEIPYMPRKKARYSLPNAATPNSAKTSARLPARKGTRQSPSP